MCEFQLTCWHYPGTMVDQQTYRVWCESEVKRFEDAGREARLVEKHMHGNRYIAVFTDGGEDGA